ncbi:aspartate/glutamate racemase family protein [Anaeromicropila herbilytica]|uniref:Aspartate racemase n=1 Tax=Anaeromicropila herbilytica TaxID=2785025 RepID=A0A7R7EQ85_9FIRM|nr:amino acid racemase [Anaeromicropila herbilytica]BCN32522.1 aspartate racemase [Anaeromicropila herbilytica]
MNEIVGVIGGNGVAATNKLCELIESEYTKNGAYRDSHHQEMIIWQATQAPSRSMYLEGKGESFIPDYIHIGKKLKACGATKICMCCNTAHYAINEIEKQVGVEFINLIELVAKEVQATGRMKVGIMASDGCVKKRLYDYYLNKICPEVSIIYPNEENQKKVTKGICNIKNLNRFVSEDNHERPKKIFLDVKEHLLNSGADIVIAGCTDIRVDYCDTNVIDSLEILKKAIMEIANHE